MLITIAAAAFIVGAGTVYLLLTSGWRRLRSTRVVINLKSGQSIDGYLVRQSGQLLFIRGAVLIHGGDQPAPMDGQVIVERSEIDFIQSP